MQFGAKPLFENISVKFGDGNRYGLIGANGCGKSTFMKILGGDLDPSAATSALDPGERLGKLRQDQFAYEDVRVLDVVMMGHTELWDAIAQRDAIYANPEATDDDYMKAAELEGKVAEYDGYSAEARAGELLLGLGIATDLHQGPMSAVAPGWKLRVLLAQALFSNPDILLLDEPTNNLDINTIRWLADMLNQRNSTMIIISHDRHFLNSGLHPRRRHGLRHAEGLSGQLRRLHGSVDPGPQPAAGEQCQGQGKGRRTAGLRAPLLGQQVQGPPGDLARQADRQDQDRGIQAVLARLSVRALRRREEAAPPGRRDRRPDQVLRPHAVQEFLDHDRGRRARGHHRRQRCRQDHAAALHRRHDITGLDADTGRIKWAENANVRATCRRIRPRNSRPT
jgi:ABC-type Mn2+/Zn2+ transport system ATPase subunit